MTFTPETETFNFTATKMRKWHQYAHPYDAAHDCLICQGDMRKFATWLKRHGFKVIKSANNFLTIKASTNVRPGAFGPTSEEVDRLYIIVAGFEEAQCQRCGTVMHVDHNNTGLFYKCSSADCSETAPVIRTCKGVSTL